MALVLKRTVEPAVEPVSVAEARSHLRVDHADDDTLIGSLVKAAREYLEDVMGRALIHQTWRLSLDAWPEVDYIELPRAPLVSVTSVVYTDSDGTAHIFSADYYAADTEREPGRVVLRYGYDWPTATLATVNPIQITYVAGYGAAATSVPEYVRQAVLLLVGHWYENRETVVVGQGLTLMPLPMAVESLIWLNRVWLSG